MHPLNFLTALLLSTVAFNAAAAPLCAQVLLAPPTQEQISVMLEELARMALEVDLEKVSGIQNGVLEGLLNKKIAEAAERLNVSKKEISAQLNTRILKIQKIDLKKSQGEQQRKSELETEINKGKKLRFSFDPYQSVYIYKKIYIGVTEIVDGRRAAIYMSRAAPADRVFKLFSNSGLAKENLIAADVFTAVVDQPRNRIVVVRTADARTASIHFYSLTDFKEISSPVSLIPNINTRSKLLFDSILRISPDGEHFILYSTEQSAFGTFKNPAAIQISDKGLSSVFMLDSHDYVTISGNKLIRDRAGQREYLDLPNEDGQIFHTISRYGEEQISVLGTRSIALVNLKTWNLSDTFEKQTASTVLKNGLIGHVIGIKDHNLVLKLLGDDDSQAATLTDRSKLRSGSRFNQIYPYPDGKGFAATARDNNTGYDWLYFFERDEAELIP